MDVKSALLNEKINESVYIEQPPGFKEIQPCVQAIKGTIRIEPNT
jgi:hypothetical protein